MAYAWPPSVAPDQYDHGSPRLPAFVPLFFIPIYPNRHILHTLNGPDLINRHTDVSL